MKKSWYCTLQKEGEIQMKKEAHNKLLESYFNLLTQLQIRKGGGARVRINFR